MRTSLMKNLAYIMKTEQDLDRAAAVNGGGFVQVVRDAAHELHQLVDEVGLGSKQGRHPQGGVQGVVDPVKLVVHHVLRNVQNNLRQEQRHDHNAEQEITALELETAETVSSNDRRNNSEHNLGDNVAVGVQECTPDGDIAAVSFGHSVIIAIQGGVRGKRGKAGKNLGVGLKGGAHHPQQRIDHDKAHQNQNKILEEGCHIGACFHTHKSIPPSISQHSRPNASGCQMR